MATEVTSTPSLQTAQTITGYFQNVALGLMPATHMDNKILQTLLTFEAPVTWLDEQH